MKRAKSDVNLNTKINICSGGGLIRYRIKPKIVRISRKKILMRRQRRIINAAIIVRKNG